MRFLYTIRPVLILVVVMAVAYRFSASWAADFLALFLIMLIGLCILIGLWIIGNKVIYPILHRRWYDYKG